MVAGSLKKKKRSEERRSFESVELKAKELRPSGGPADAEFVFVESADDAETANAAGQSRQESTTSDFSGMRNRSYG